MYKICGYHFNFEEGADGAAHIIYGVMHSIMKMAGFHIIHTFTSDTWDC